MIARHARFALALAMLGTAGWTQSVAAAPPEVCQAVTVREGDPIPPDACAVNILPRDLDVSNLIFGEGPAWTPLDPQAMPGVFYDLSLIHI